MRALLWLPLTVLGIRWMGVRRWTSLLERVSAPKASSPSAQPPEATARMVAAAARRSLIPSNCLSRSVVLVWFFRRQGHGAELRFGSRKDGKLLEAHAWVELDGKVFDVSEADPAGFVPFDRPVVTGEGKPQ